VVKVIAAVLLRLSNSGCQGV